MKKNTNSIVLNQITYDAVMSMLTSKNGIDISPILNDLQGQSQAAALNAGLLMHGKKLELSYKVAYSVSGDGTIYEYNVDEVSFITNRVRGSYYRLMLDESGNYTQDTDWSYESTIEDFLAKEPLFEVVRAESEEKLAKRKQK